MMLLLLLAAAAQPGDIKTYKDWTVGCDNGRACRAVSLIAEEGDWETMLGIAIARDAGPDAQPVITLTAESGKAYRLRGDGKGPAIRIAAQGEDYRVDARDVGAALAAIRGAGRLDVEDGEGRRIGQVSLAGASAALLYMDDVQKRVGTVTALARPGSAPASAVPGPPPLPTVQNASVKGPPPFTVAPAQIAALRKTHGCVPENPDLPGYEVSQDKLDATRVLVLLGCGAGAYNSSSLALVATRNGSRIEAVPAGYDVLPSSGDELPLLVNAEWEPGEILGSWSKGRGVGDCGISSFYVWDGTRFRLTERNEMRECRGSMELITTWRATVTR